MNIRDKSSDICTVLVTDCGSTTTKALLFEERENLWRMTYRGEAPTTVEEPVADVTVGALNAFIEIEELSGKKIIDYEKLDKGEIPFNFQNNGIDLYLSTSSAGGGLQMLVAGVVRNITAESAQRAALGAGAIVLDVISADDGRREFERIQRVRHLRPDIILLTGGVDGGSKSHVIEIAELLLSASPKPRFGETVRVPVIYAGNKDASEHVKSILEKFADVTIVPNVRPSLEREDLGPAREAVHEFFLSHVMSHSPGYGKLMSWSNRPIIPTPAAVGDVVKNYASKHDVEVLCADIGGATTDVFSVFKNKQGEHIFNRTVSANLGMSYSMANVLLEAGIDNIVRWLPYKVSDSEVRDQLRNKMIRPTSVPQTLEDLWLEQAVCREALRLSLRHHKSLAVGLSGVQQQRGISDVFSQDRSRYELVDMKRLDMVIGSGGVLSHAPRRMDALLMMLDGFELSGLTQVVVDSIFMMPHIGAFLSIDSLGAESIFKNDCIVNVGHVICPVFPERKSSLTEIASVYINRVQLGTVICGKVLNIKLEGQETEIEIRPLFKEVDVGAGRGQVLERKIEVGLCGLVLDGRNRPLKTPNSRDECVAQQKEIFKNLGIL